jgi:hypothetical protein
MEIAFGLEALQILVFMDLGVGVHHKENGVPGGLKSFDCGDEILDHLFLWSWRGKVL